MTSTAVQCDLCNELSGRSENSFAQTYKGDPESRVLFRSEQFAIVPSLGHMVEGYLLVLPTKHFRAFGDLTGPCIDELATTLERVGEVVKNYYGSYVLFEHGARSEGTGGCGVYHAHLHATPLAANLDPVATLKATFPYTELESVEEIGKQSGHLPSYLFYRDSAAKLYLFDTGPLPSQYMRRLIADALHDSNWNWRTAGREERLLATMERLSGRFTGTQKDARPSQITNVSR
jgi:diadenosine tetraphosphate (Ap4A) HIT family hydrolase